MRLLSDTPLRRITAYGSQGKQAWPWASLVPCISTSMTFGYRLPEKQLLDACTRINPLSPGTLDVSSPLSISTKPAPVSDSASPLRQTWLSHSPESHLPPCWHDLPASDGTSFPARCAHSLQNPTSPNISMPGSSVVLLSAPCGAILAALPLRPTLSAWKGWGGLVQCRSWTLAREMVLSQQHTTAPVRRGSSAQHALGLPSTQSYQGGKQSQNVVSKPGVVLFWCCHSKGHEMETLYIAKLCCFLAISPNSYHSLSGHSTDHWSHPSSDHHAAGKWDEAER